MASGVDDLLLRAVLHGEIPSIVVVARENPHVPLPKLLGERLMDLAVEARARRCVEVHEHDPSLLLLQRPKGGGEIEHRGTRSENNVDIRFVQASREFRHHLNGKRVGRSSRGTGRGVSSYQGIVGRVLINDGHVRPLIVLDEGHARVIVVLVGNGQTDKAGIGRIAL